MKKFIAVLFLAVFGVSVYAQNVSVQVQKDAQKTPYSWDFISFTFAPGVPPSSEVADVYGVKVGVPIGFGDKSFVAGTEISLLSSTTPYVYGVQGAVLFNTATEVDGLQASFIYNYAKDVKGVQFSVVNYAEDSAFQIGLINIIKDSPIPFMIGLNIWF